MLLQPRSRRREQAAETAEAEAVAAVDAAAHSRRGLLRRRQPSASQLSRPLVTDSRLAPMRCRIEGMLLKSIWLTRRTCCKCARQELRTQSPLLKTGKV